MMRGSQTRAAGRVQGCSNGDGSREQMVGVNKSATGQLGCESNQPGCQILRTSTTLILWDLFHAGTLSPGAGLDRGSGCMTQLQLRGRRDAGASKIALFSPLELPLWAVLGTMIEAGEI